MSFNRYLTLHAFSIICLIFTPMLARAAVQGYVDMHSHLTAEESFGGGWFWGSINGPMDWAVRRNSLGVTILVGTSSNGVVTIDGSARNFLELKYLALVQSKILNSGRARNR